MIKVAFYSSGEIIFQQMLMKQLANRLELKIKYDLAPQSLYHNKR